jgi:predicted component of type VI protein secretion system
MRHLRRLFNTESLTSFTLDKIRELRDSFVLFFEL